MNQPNPHEAVLMRVPAHLYDEVRDALQRAGYDLRGDGNYRKVISIPEFLKFNSRIIGGI